jgi:uncharacterized DUF497 family protein
LSSKTKRPRFCREPRTGVAAIFPNSHRTGKARKLREARGVPVLGREGPASLPDLLRAIITVMTYNERVTIRLDWDEKKSRVLERKRGLTFDQVSKVFEGVTVELLKNDDPLQFAAIGSVDVDLVTVIFEERRDEEGVYLWLVTYWRSTTREREIYEQETKGLHRED